MKINDLIALAQLGLLCAKQLDSETLADTLSVSPSDERLSHIRQLAEEIPTADELESLASDIEINPTEFTWVTVGTASIKINHSDDGVIIALYPVGFENDDALLDTWYTWGELENHAEDLMRLGDIDEVVQAILKGLNCLEGRTSRPLEQSHYGCIRSALHALLEKYTDSEITKDKEGNLQSELVVCSEHTQKGEKPSDVISDEMIRLIRNTLVELGATPTGIKLLRDEVQKNIINFIKGSTDEIK